MTNELQLVDAAKAGSAKAFADLVESYRVRLLRFLLTRCASHADAEDALQDTFIAAYRYLHSYDPRWRFSTWLYRIAINTAKNHLVSRSRRPPTSDVEVADAEYYEGGGALRDLDTPESAFFGEELKAVIDKAISALPADLRTAVTLREFDSMSYEDIAEIMDCPVGTVRSRIFRARESIDKQVREQIDGDI